MNNNMIMLITTNRYDDCHLLSKTVCISGTNRQPKSPLNEGSCDRPRTRTANQLIKSQLLYH